MAARRSRRSSSSRRRSRRSCRRRHPRAAAPAGGAAAGETVAGTQVYEVQSGDFLGGIADDYGIPPESIANFNQWDDGVEHMLHPGDVINIPPGAQVPDRPTRRRRLAGLQTTRAPTPRRHRKRSTPTTRPVRRRLAPGHLHDRGRRHPGPGRREPRRHGRPAQRGERQHARLQRLHRRRRHPRAVRGRGLIRRRQARRTF